ncbi:unnamed protein product [Cyberlindnera jadinii]|uniref:WSC domain-containing protein n=1 Tax=Cyberlindnera jadinii (strain ATCC 18201 / CBS 1600 / BCRC 20928 / JCM 3617 / NBRC 0987 / NRRL Y-1542) TaxID=983966 RepID=A0A0H5CA46_CYBJN|nr:unnamed protein product [Cyberlindnera jadinii]
MVSVVPLVLVSVLSSLASAEYSSSGCYSLSSLESVLTSRGEYTYQTNSYCQEQCAGYAVAATMDGSTCYCSNQLPSNISPVSSSLCSSTCNGYPQELCGGDGYLSVYANGEQDTSPIGESSSSSSSTISTSNTPTTLSTSTSASSTTSTLSTSTSSTSTSSTSTSSASAATQTTSSTSSSRSSSTSSSVTSSTSTTASALVTTQVSVITSIITASHGAATTVTQTIESTGYATPTASSAGSSSSAASSSTTSSGSSGLSKGAIAGIAVGSVVGGLLLLGLLLLFCLRRRYSSEDDDESEHTEKPVHNDMYDYYNVDGDFDTHIPPIPYYMQENGRKRLSNGSLPDASVDNQKTLRVTNPDEFTFAESTLYEGDNSNSDDDDDSIKRFN